MKKNFIIAILVLVNVITMGIGLSTSYSKQNKLDNLTEEYNSVISNYRALNNKRNCLEEELKELGNQLNELEEGVYRVMNGENYEIEIDHDDKHITYTKKGKGLIKSESVITTW